MVIALYSYITDRSNMQQPSLSSNAASSAGKLVYIDHLRVVLTALVIIHHAFVTYGAPGSWYYNEKATALGAIIPMTMVVAIDQAFFMGFFFFLAALFTPSSYDKKGAERFVTDRLVRLGLPLAFYSFVLSPFLSYLPYRFAEGHHITYLQYLSGFDGWVNFGVLWFVAALLIFTLVYVGYRSATGAGSRTVKAPSATKIVLFALFVGMVSYMVRIIFPVGWTLKPLGFQLGHFPQYIALFILGLLAARNNWLNSDNLAGRRLLWPVILLALMGMPLFFIVRRIVGFPIAYFSSTAHWAQLWYAVWEQVTGFGMVVVMLYYGKRLWNKPSAFLAKLGRSSFAVYIFHPLVLVALSVAIKPWAVDPGIKAVVVAPLAVVLSFVLGTMVVRIPIVNKIV
jgi:peptidoglycan/LPS O-acetylase OafA/YrhL